MNVSTFIICLSNKHRVCAHVFMPISLFLSVIYFHARTCVHPRMWVNVYMCISLSLSLTCMHVCVCVCVCIYEFVNMCLVCTFITWLCAHIMALCTFIAWLCAHLLHGFVHIYCMAVCTSSAVWYQDILRSESAVCTVHFLVIILPKTHINVHKTHLRCPKNTLYFRPSQEHVHRPHQTPFHCHQLFPKHSGYHQPEPSRITLLKPKDVCIDFAW